MTAFTLDDYNTLVKAIAGGARKVKYQDKEVEYMSLKDMNQIKAQMEKELGISKTGGTGRSIAVYNSGL